MPLWIFFLHRSYSNKPNKIYFIIFAFFLDFIWNLQFTAEINTKYIKEIPPNPLTSGPHWSVEQNRGGGGGAARRARARARRRRGQGPAAAAAANGGPRRAKPRPRQGPRARGAGQRKARGAGGRRGGGGARRSRRRWGQAAAGRRGASISGVGRLWCARKGVAGWCRRGSRRTAAAAQ